MKKIQIKITTFNKKSLEIYEAFVLNILNKLKIPFVSIRLPNKITRLTLLKSPHVHKKAREQFEQKTFKVLIEINNDINISLLKLIAINKPKNIKLKINTKF